MRTKTIRYGAAGVAGILLALLLVVMVNWIGARHYRRWDWTSTRIFSLSEKTTELLSRLDKEIDVYAFIVPGAPLYDQARELLTRYAAASDKLKVEFVDPVRERLRADTLAQQFGISADNTVVFSFEGRSKYVTADQMAEYDYSGMQMGQPPSVKAFKGEEEFTAAILSLVAPEVPKVYFVGGHGEPTLDAGGGLAVINEALKRDNVSTESLMLLSGTIPDDADLVAIIGPTEPFAQMEVDLLAEFLDKGGRLLVCLDPLIAPDGTMKSTRLEAMLAAHGVEVHDDLVVDPSRKLPFYDLSAVYLTDLGQHPITKGLDGVAMLFLVARSVGVAPGFETSAHTLVKTTAEGWGESNLGQLLRGDPIAPDDGDTKGPAAVAVAVELGDDTPADPAVEDGDPSGETVASGKGGRLVVFGDSDFLADTAVENLGNLALALNSFNWLIARDTSVGIPPRQVGELRLYLSSDQLLGIQLLCLVLLPAAAIVAGVMVWRRRRH